MALLQVTIQSKRSFPVWSLGHFVVSTELSYLRQLQISRIVHHFDQGAVDAQFFVGRYSAKLYPAGEVGQVQPEVVVLAEKGLSADRFWNTFRKLRRPIVFFRRSIDEPHNFEPLYSPTDDEALKILNASVRTPIHLSFAGLDKVVRQLFYGRRDERRTQERHEAEIAILQAQVDVEHARAMGAQLDLINQIQNSSVSEPYKQVMIEQVLATTRRQSYLNRQLTAVINVSPLPNPESPQSLEDDRSQRLPRS